MDSVIADDDDTGSTNLTYSIATTDFADAFAIDPSTGVIRRNTVQLNFETQSRYDLQVKVHDASGLASAAQSVTIWVGDVNEAPFIKSSAVARTVREDASIGTVVGAIECVDPDGDTVSLAITGGNTLELFALQANSIIVAKIGLDYQQTRTHTLRVRCVEMNHGAAPLDFSADIVVTVLDVNDAPVATNQTRAVSENSRMGVAIGAPLIASDPDAGQQLQFTILSGNNASFFTIDSMTGQLAVGKGPMDEYVGCFRRLVEVSATMQSIELAYSTDPVADCASQCNAHQYFAIRAGSQCWCSNVLQVPGSTFQADNGDCATYMCRNGRDQLCGGADTFAVYRHMDGLDFERVSSYSLQIEVRDNGYPSMATQFTATVVITDVNEPPSLMLQPIQVKENVGIRLNASSFAVVADEDSGDTYELALVGCSVNPCPFFFDSAPFNVLRTKRKLDYESVATYTLVFRALDRGGLVDTAEVTVTVLDTSEPPVIDDSAVRKILENSPTGTLIGPPIRAFDPDASDKIAYAITSQDSPGCVRIDASTGQLYIANEACFDYEAFRFDNLLAPSFNPVQLSGGGDNVVSIEAILFPSEFQNASYVELVVMYGSSSVTSDKTVPTVVETLMQNLNLRLQMSPFGTVAIAMPRKADVEQVVETPGYFIATVGFALPILRGATTTVDVRFGSGSWARLLAVRDLKKIFSVLVAVHDSSPEALRASQAFAIEVVDVNEPPVFLGSATLAIDENSPQGTYRRWFSSKPLLRPGSR